MRWSFALLILFALVGGLSCKKESAPAEERAVAEAPKELPGKVVPRTPEAPAPAPAGSPGEDYPLIGTDEIGGDAELRRTISALADAFSAKRVMETLAADKEAAIPALRAALRHRERNVRIQSAQILSRFAAPSDETTEAFVEALRKDPDPEVRAAVARELRGYVHAPLVDVLLQVLASDPHETARANAAWALGDQGDAKAVDGLIAALEDSETWVRLRSVTALMKLRAKKALPALLERLKDDNVTVRERALKALQKISGKKYGDDYERWKKALRVR